MLLKNIIQEDISMAITDRTNFLAYYQGDNLKQNIKVGDRIPPGSIIEKVINTNKIVSEIESEEISAIIQNIAENSERLVSYLKID